MVGERESERKGREYTMHVRVRVRVRVNEAGKARMSGRGGEAQECQCNWTIKKRRYKRHRRKKVNVVKGGRGLVCAHLCGLKGLVGARSHQKCNGFCVEFCSFCKLAQLVSFVSCSLCCHYFCRCVVLLFLPLVCNNSWHR